MALVAYLPVLASCFLHALWNFALRRARGSELVVAWSKVAEAVLFLGPFVLAVRHADLGVAALWPWVPVGALLTGLNYLFLARAYREGALSLVYPLSRAGALLFLPGLACVLDGQRVGSLGLVAIALVLAGSVLTQASDGDQRMGELWRGLARRSTIFALLAALTVACYSLWDRRAVQQLPAFVYFYGYTAALAGFFALRLVRAPRGRAQGELREHGRAVLIIAGANTAGYLLVLVSLRKGNPTYVIAIRQLSIAIGVFLGWRWLGEPIPRIRLAGVVALVLGCLLVAIAR